MTRRLHAYIDGHRRLDLEKLSPAMWSMLHDTRVHADPYYSLSGRSAIGGASWTRMALCRAKLMAGTDLTAAGREAIERVEWREPV